LQALKDLLHKLSGLRDVQVQKNVLTSKVAEHPELAGLWLELEKQELDLNKSAAKSVRQFCATKLARQLEKLQEELTDPTAHLAEKSCLRQRVIQAVTYAHANVMERRRAIDLRVPSTLHKTRTVFKKFRYMVESLPPAVARPSRSLLSAMSDYQAALGK